MTREDLINFIPKPTNKDVILYDISLKKLIDVDVFEEYKQLLPIYNLHMQKYQSYKNSIDKYNNTLNDIYLYKNNWSEEDYLYYLQNEKKTYANLFGPIRRIESNIETLQKKIKQIQDKINLQIAKENKQIEEKKKNIDKKIDETATKILELKDVLSTFKAEKERIKKDIIENEEEFLLLQTMIENAQNGQCKCEYCGTTISKVSPNSRFYTRIYKKIEENKKQIEKILKLREQNEEQIDIYNKKIKELRKEIQNDINFKSEDFNFYRKKSIEVLKLEGQRDAMLNNIAELEKQLANNSQTKSKQFLEIKDKISKYELSLENLKKIKEIKQEIQIKQQENSELYQELKQMNQKMNDFKKFLTIFFKIYEKKAAEFCGKEFKFKIFEFEDFALKEIFIIYYNEIEYNNLNTKSKKIVNDILDEKFLLYNQ